jgi:hypothetical protein
MRDIVEWLLEYGKYGLVAAGLFFGLTHAGHEMSVAVQGMIVSTGNSISHSMFIGKGDGPMLEISEKGISLPSADQKRMP